MALGQGMGLWNMTAKAQMIKEMDKLIFLEIKSVCALKGVTKKAERQRTERQNTAANHAYGEGPESTWKNSYDPQKDR